MTLSPAAGTLQQEQLLGRGLADLIHFRNTPLGLSADNLLSPPIEKPIASSFEDGVEENGEVNSKRNLAHI